MWLAAIIQNVIRMLTGSFKIFQLLFVLVNIYICILNFFSFVLDLTGHGMITWQFCGSLADLEWFRREILQHNDINICFSIVNEIRKRIFFLSESECKIINKIFRPQTEILKWSWPCANFGTPYTRYVNANCAAECR